MRRRDGWTVFYLSERDSGELLGTFYTERQALLAAYRLPDSVPWRVEESAVFSHDNGGCGI